MTDDSEEISHHYPTTQEVRDIVTAIIQHIDRSGPPKVSATWLADQKPKEPPPKPDIVYSQAEVDAAKQLAREELARLAAEIAAPTSPEAGCAT